MLEHTLDRAIAASGSERLVTVIGAGHSRSLNGSLAAFPGRVIEQPANRDTAPGILLPLTHVMGADPDASVAIFPSDHYISPNSRFMAHVESAFLIAERAEGKLVLLGAVPDRPERDYGWIQPEREPGTGAVSGARLVRRFREKPGQVEAAGFYRDGYLWNTFIMFAKAKTLWALASEMLPEIAASFDSLLGALGTEQEPAILARIYRTMPRANFSTQILETGAGRTVVVPLEGVDWSDWGRPERVEETLAKAGSQRYDCDLADV
jgi:mannose-1-phosphate guanylyltransferase